MSGASRGTARRQKGDFDEAVKDLSRALELVPGEAWTTEQLALAKRRQR